MGRQRDIGTPRWVDNKSLWKLGVQRNGKRKYFYSSIPGRRGQRECENQALAWLNRDLTDGTADPIISDLYSAWLDETLKIGGNATHRKNESIGRIHILPVIGHLHISKLRTEQQLQDVINTAWAKKHNGRRLSKKTLSNIRTTLLSFIKYCRKCGYTTLHPENITLPRQAQLVGRRTLQPNELRILLTESETARRYAWDMEPNHEWFIHAFRFQVLTGLRPGELIGLMWRDISGSVVRIRQSINWHGELTPGKNANARRTFVAPQMAVRELQAQSEQMRSHKIKTAYVFADDRGEPVSQKRYARRLERFCEFHDIPVISPYELRHTWYSINKTLPAELVKQMGGHSEAMDTFGVYGHELNGEMEETARLIDGIVSALLKT